MDKGKDDFLGGLFDFDGDGKTDVFEQGLAYMMYEDITKEDNEESDELDDNDGDLDFEPSPFCSTTHRSYSPDSASSIVSTPVDRPETEKPVSSSTPINLTAEYKYRKKCLIGAFLGVLFFVTIWIGTFTLISLAGCDGDKNAAGRTVGILFGVISCIIIYVSWMHPVFKPYVDTYRSAKETWLESLNESETKKQNGKRAASITVVVLLILGILAAIIVPKAVKSSRDASMLSEARELITTGDYSAARKLLYGNFPYNHEESNALISLCDAYSYYERGNVSSAYYALYRTKLNLLGPELKKDASAFLEALKEEKEVYDKEQEEKAAQERAEYENKIRTGVPFVGLAENRISDTSLGKPDPNMRRTVGTYGGKDVIFYRYDYVRNKMIIYSAYCYNGKVVKVEDYRSSPIPTKKPSSSSGSSSSYVYPDPKEFDDPSDFYYWYYDEFVDYEEAEEYYYSHGGR